MAVKVGIIGYGVVGKGIHRLLGSDVLAIYDPYLPNDTRFDFSDKSKFSELDLIVVCVMTKENPDGSCDTSVVEESLDWAYSLNKSAVFFIKSAVVPSRVRQIKKVFKDMRLVISPEYMGESSYFTPEWKYPHPQNMESHTFQVYGGELADTSFVVDVFKRKMGVDTVHFQTDLMTASLCKYMENSFFATKVTFCNEWFDLAEKYGVDFNTLREAWLLDPRVNRNHTMVFPDKRGYGGKCFPKDIKAIIHDAEKMGYSMSLLKEVNSTNNKFLEHNETGNIK